MRTKQHDRVSLLQDVVRLWEELNVTANSHLKVYYTHNSQMAPAWGTGYAQLTSQMLTLPLSFVSWQRKYSNNRVQQGTRRYTRVAECRAAREHL